ncbi:MAG: metal ABC transporter permease [Spirochaetes bacterium]|nr:metal ABC transporter permease [Spirochaetota bacterium]
MNDVIAAAGKALSYGFIQRALAAGLLVAVSCSLIGLFLVLRKLSLIGDGLAHVSFASVALALALGASPLFVSLPLVVLASLGILKISERSANGDAAIGILSSLGVAVGVLLASLGGGFNVDLFGYLFGSILAIGPAELLFSVIVSIAVAALVAFFYADLFSIAYDEEFARAAGVRTRTIGRVLVVLAASVVTIGIRVVGTMLVSALIVLPASSALQLGRSFRSTLWISAAIAGVSVVAGILVSYLLDLPAGATIVIANFLIFSACFAAGRARA